MRVTGVAVLYFAVDLPVYAVFFIIAINAVFGDKGKPFHLLKSLVKTGIAQHSINKILGV